MRRHDCFSSAALDHITDALVSPHWLRVPEHVQDKIALLTYKVLHGAAAPYIEPFVGVADLPSRRALRSASTRLVVLTFKRSAVSGRAFQVSASQIWIELPEDVATALSEDIGLPLPEVIS